ncbi:MAG: outer membrane protein assembly factor BamA [Desulfobulbaceae bacterium]|nr:outer membrane protein assembly factor BamA [Desulfobulbaceae bacterium]
MTHKLITFCLAAIFAIISTNFAVTQAGAADQETATIFLPLKINTVTAEDKLAEDGDRLLTTAVTGSGMIILERSEATAKLQEGNWPPPPSSLKSVLPADYQGNVAIGSLTRLDKQIKLDMTVIDLRDPAATGYFSEDIPTDKDLATAIDEIVKQSINFVKRHQLIASIKIAGNRRIDSGAILRKISSRAGDDFNASKLSKDLKEVFTMGYFGDIQISTEETPAGHEITFTVQERAVIGKIQITGNDKLIEEDLRAAIKIKSHSIISDKGIKDSIDNIRNLYREDGYFNSQVTVEQTKTGAKKDRVDLTFVIDEGTKIFIKEIIITGNKTFTAGEIKKVISTSEKGWLSFITDSGLMHKEKLEQDATRIGAFYHNNGFVEAKIGEPEIVQKGEWFYVYFNINEGVRYKCGTVKLSGDLIVEEDTLRKMIKVDQEEFFSRMVLRKDVLRINDFYAEKGYAFAETQPKTTKNRAEQTVDLDFQISKQQLMTINRINIKGNTRTRDKVIRREILLKEGGLFNATKLKKSNQRLGRIDFFEDVNISPEPGIDDSQLDLNVEVKEKPTGKFSIGGGYSTVDKMTFMGEVSENNLFGRGQKLALQANVSSNSNKFNLNFTEPHLFDSKLLIAFSAYNWEREYDDYTKDSQGGSISLGYPLWRKWRLNIGFGIDDTNLTDVDLTTASDEIKDSMEYHKTNSVKIALRRDTRNRMYGANKGSRNNLSMKYAGGPLSGDNSYTKLEASSSWYFPVSKKTTLHPKLTAGYIAGNSSGHLPVFEKFYLGGLSSIRSFDNGQISPIDPVSGDRIGGNKMWYANLEYIFPLANTQGLSGVVFYDIGNVYDLDQRWQLENYKQSAGAGIRWMSPIGPLSLMWGYNLDPVGDEDTKNWEFSIGGAF